jgi:hypothetical protein
VREGFGLPLSLSAVSPGSDFWPAFRSPIVREGVGFFAAQMAPLTVGLLMAFEAAP